MFYYGYTVLSPFDRRGNDIKKRGEAPLKKLPHPLVKEKGIKGMGLLILYF